MSELYFLKKGIVSVEEAKATIIDISNLDLDMETKMAYKDMVQNIGSYIEFMYGRIEYLKNS